MNEIWKDVINYEGLYQVSNFGKIKSCNKFDSIGRLRKEKLLKQQKNKWGYNFVRIAKNGKQHNCSVHRLVYEAFNGKIPEGMQVNHINEVKTDNRLDNLNLMTPKENSNWGTGIERQRIQMINGKKSKPVLQYDKDGNFIKEWPSLSEINRQLGFNLGNLSLCCNGKLNQAYEYKWKYKNVS